MENIPQNPGQNLLNSKREFVVGLIGLILVLLWPIAYQIHSTIREKRISVGVAQSNQEFQKFQEQFDSPKLGDSRLNEFIKKQEAQKPKARVLEIILFYFIYRISPIGGFLFGLLGIFKDKRWWKIIGILSVTGAFYIVYLILLERAIFRMV